MKINAKMHQLKNIFSEKEYEAYFEEVYKSYFDRLYGFALLITKSESLAKDVVSEVFFNLWNTKKDLYSINKLKSYLFTSVKNQAIKAVSGHHPQRLYDHPKYGGAATEHINPEELLVGKELDQFLNNTIEELAPHCALVFRMLKEENMMYGEVADELGISVDTVKYHLKIALKKIRSKLEKYYKK